MIISEVDVKSWLGDELSQGTHVTTAYRAAEAYVSNRCEWAGYDAVPPAPAPEDLRLAVCMMTRRLLGRRQAWNGVIALTSELAGRIASVDQDIEGLMSPHRSIGIA